MMNFPLDPTDGELQTAIRLAWRTYAQTCRQLLAADGLTLAGLESIRRDLRTSGAWRAGIVPAELENDRALLLDEVSRRIGAARGFPDYYAGAGDTLPDAPDDISGLVGGGE